MPTEIDTLAHLHTPLFHEVTQNMTAPPAGAERGA